MGLAWDSQSNQLFMSYANSGPGGGVETFSAGSGGTLSSTPASFVTISNGSLYAIAYQAPEPGTPLMLAGGLIAIGLFRFRRARP